MIPRPIATTTPIAIHAGATCASTPAFHSARVTPSTNTTQPTKYMFTKRIRLLVARERC